MFQTAYDSLLTLFYPQICEICENSLEKSENGLACEGCWQETRIFSPKENLCVKCGRFLYSSRPERTANCHQCLEHSYENARATGIYEKALAASIIHLKREPYICRRLGRLLEEASENPLFEDLSVIIPIPLSKKRLLARGFNQAELLAEIVSKHLQVQIDTRSLIRSKHAKVHRAGMDRRGRELSVKRSFEVKRVNKIKGKNILLIDDVLTSGATVSSCASVLKKSGAENVYVLTAARAA